MSQMNAEAPRALLDREAWVRWLTSARAEQPPFSKTCGHHGCTNAVSGPFDLFCAPTDGGGALHLLPLVGQKTAQTISVYALRSIFALLPLLAATSHSAIPLYVGACIAGVLILALPLRSFAVAGVLAPVLWICAIGVAASIREGQLDAAATNDVELTLVVLTLAVLLGTVFMRRGPEGDRDLTLCGISTGLAVVLVTGALCIAFTLGFANVTKTVPHILLIACISAAGGVFTTAVIASLVRGVRSVKHMRRFTRPGQLEPKPFRQPIPPRAGAQDVLSRLLFRLQWIFIRIATAAVEAVNSAVRLICGVVNLMVLWVALAVHYCKLVFVWIAKLLAAAADETVRTINAAARALAEALSRWAQTTALGVALFAAAAGAAANACSLFRSYLDGGTLPHAILSIVLALLAIVALAMVWWALTRRPARDVAKAAQRNAEAAGPVIFITLVALGWIDGIVGILGYGPMRPGWLTVAGTVVLMLGLVVAYRNNRSEDLSAAEHDAST
jgi:cbb3-type cytochrome oxidase subunit 3